MAWESLGWFDIVARYARLVSMANEPNAQVTLLGEARQLEDRLGLTPMAMLRLRWECVDDDEAFGQQSTDDSGVLDIRARLQAAD